MKPNILATVLFLILLQNLNIYAVDGSASYKVMFYEKKVVVDGVLNEDVWKLVPQIDGTFTFNWENKMPERTIFQAFHDDKNFYFSFTCYDKDIVVNNTWSNESTINTEDRVMIFLAQSQIDIPIGYDLPTYFGIEIDPLARINDYSATFYRNINSIWNIPTIQVAAKISNGVYVVEGFIPKTVLKTLQVFDDKKNTMIVGVYRADFSKKGKDIIMNWISWMDPKTKVSDFHTANSFGNFIFVKE